jgi:hypothetical protein
MRQRDERAPDRADNTLRDILRAIRRFLCRGQDPIVLQGLHGEGSIVDLCRKEAHRPEPLLALVEEAPGSRQKAVAGDITVREATSDDVTTLRAEASPLKETLDGSSDVGAHTSQRIAAA